MSDKKIEIPDDTIVYLCSLEWCDEPYAVHVDPPEMFIAWVFTPPDLELHTNDNGLACVPLDEMQEMALKHCYRMPCGTWWVIRPQKMTMAEARKKWDR